MQISVIEADWPLHRVQKSLIVSYWVTTKFIVFWANQKQDDHWSISTSSVFLFVCFLLLHVKTFWKMAYSSRFHDSNESEIKYLKDKAHNKNTGLSTNTWVNAFKYLAKTRCKNEDLTSYKPKELDTALQLFHVEVRKKEGADYEPECLRVMRAGLDLERHLKEKNYSKSIIRDEIFAECDRILEGKAMELRDNGKGHRPNQERALMEAEERILWDCGQFVDKTPQALLNTLWHFVTQHFGMLSTRGEKCIVQIFRTYVFRRPEALRDSRPFHLQPLSSPRGITWFKRVPLGNMMNKMKKNSPLSKLCASKKLTNHSARKTVVKKLQSNGVHKSEIRTITGHASTKGMDSYDESDERQQ